MTTVNVSSLESQTQLAGAGAAVEDNSSPTLLDIPIHDQPPLLQDVEKAVTSADVAIKNDKLTKEPEHLVKQGKNSVTMANVFKSQIGNADLMLTNNMLEKAISTVLDRDDVCSRNALGLLLSGRTVLHSCHNTPTTIQKTHIWHRWYAANSIIRNYTIKFEATPAKTFFSSDAASIYFIGTNVDYRKISSSLIGENLMIRGVAEQISDTIKTNLAVYDHQSIFFIGWLLFFMITDIEVEENAAVVLRNIRNNIVMINIFAPDAAGQAVAANAFRNALANGYVTLIGEKYNDDEVHIMQLIASGPSALNATYYAACHHIGSHIDTPEVQWALINRANRAVGAIARVPDSTSILSFMRRLAIDLHVEDDLLKGYTRACSVINGFIYYYAIDEGGAESPAASDDEDDAQNENQNEDQCQGGGDQQPAFQMVHVRDRMPARDPFDAAEPPVIRPNDVDDAIWALIGPVHEMMRTQRVNTARSNARMEAQRRQLLADIADEREEVRRLREEAMAAPVVAEPILPARCEPRVSQRRHYWVVGCRHDVMYTAYYVPSTIEIGGTSMPAIFGYNVLWRVLGLASAMKAPEWALYDTERLLGASSDTLVRAGAVMAAMVSVGVSVTFNTVCIRGRDIHAWAGGFDNVNPGTCRFMLEQLFRPSFYDECLISENIPSVMADMYGVAMNPNVLYMRHYASSLEFYPDWGEDRSLSLIFGTSAPYVVHPLLLTNITKEWPHVLGWGAPLVTMDLKQDMAAYGAANQRGWWSRRGTDEYDTAFEDAPHTAISYGIAVINALAQHYRWPALPQVYFLPLVEAGGGSAIQLDMLAANDVLYDEDAFCIMPGRCLSYDWLTREVLSPCLIAPHLTLVQFTEIHSITPSVPLSAGYFALSGLVTAIRAASQSVPLSKKLFKGRPPTGRGLPGLGASTSQQAGN